MLEVTINIVVIFLLVVTIYFCWHLNKKIIEIRDSKKDLSQLANNFDIAIIKTHKSISDLKALSENSSKELYSYVSKANELISDLSFMTDTAANLADRLEVSIKAARQVPSDHEDSNLEKVISSIPSNDDAKYYTSPSSTLSRTRQDLIEAIKITKDR
jgi:hypothetical protein